MRSLDDPETRALLFALGWTAQMIVRYPAHAMLTMLAFYAYPWATFQLIRLITVEGVKTSARLGYGTAKIFAPKTTQRGVIAAQNVRRFFANPIPEWMQTGSAVAKGSFATAILGTGIGMIAEANAKANRGDIGGETTLGDFTMDASFNMDMNTIAHEPYQSRPMYMHRLGGPGGIII